MSEARPRRDRNLSGEVALLLATCCSDPGIIPPRQLIVATGWSIWSRLVVWFFLAAPASTGKVPIKGKHCFIASAQGVR